MIDYSIFKSYDIRGTYPQQINESNLYQIIQAIYAFYANHLNQYQLYHCRYPARLESESDIVLDMTDACHGQW